MNLSNPKSLVSVARGRNLLVAALALGPLLAVGQTAATAPSAPPPTSQEQTVTLNPFEVQSDSDKGYSALNSNSITAFNTALDHTPVTADIMDQSFMDDMNITNVEMAVQSYDAGSQFSALSIANVSQDQPGDHVANGALKLRGNSIGGEQFNGLLMAGALGNPGGTSFGETSNYDLERIEILDGPQGLLLAGNGSGGVINLITKQARIGQPTFGSVSYRIDQYGTKYGTFDYGTSAGKIAVRIALVDGSSSSRRVNIGEKLVGQYVQLAAEVGNTVFRVSLQQSVDTRLIQDYATITSSSGDPFFGFNSYNLTYLLASHQTAGILNNNLNWNNAQSFEGNWDGDTDVTEMGIFNAESKWTNWLSTSFSLAAGNFNDDQFGAGTINLYTPGAASNPLPGNWTMGMPLSGPPVEDDWRPHRNKAISFTAVLTNDLFHGRATSHTSLNADYTGNLNGIIAYSYYQADSNFNALVNTAVTANAGRTLIPAQQWTVNNGPVQYNLFNTGANRITLNGVNYVRQLVTPVNPAVPSSTGLNADFNEGYALVNYTQWLDGRLDTMAGVRMADQKTWNYGLVPNQIEKPDYSIGADYHVLTWLAPYVSYSDAYVTPIADNPTPDGGNPPISHAINYEGGFKINTDGGKLSGSLSYYRSVAKQEEFTAGTIAADVDPNGLNGEAISGGAAANGNNFSANADTHGITAALTAAPTKNWRMRLSAAWTAGSFGSGVAYSQLYNDQFHENSAGQVTYADGTVVYVPPTFNSKTLTEPSTTAGAIPLTVTALSTPGNAYFASPAAVTGSILKTSPGGLVLLSPADPNHGAILTGATGQPIAAYQLNTALSGVTPIGTLYPVLAGQQTWGYPAYSANFTSIYEFSDGCLKGFRLGGTATGSWKNVKEYYYPNGFTGTNFSQELQFTMPTLSRFDLIAGYSRKFGRVLWSTQLNINNLFNHYHIVIYPNQTTGFSTLSALTANFDQQPRAIAWKNTIAF